MKLTYSFLELEIKTENLAEIITTSRADYLVVLGDRNMKNRTCQAKNKGKLTEMDVRHIYYYLDLKRRY